MNFALNVVDEETVKKLIELVNHWTDKFHKSLKNEMENPDINDVNEWHDERN